jgi:NAD(P)H-flavin reductase/ferredoxin
MPQVKVGSGSYVTAEGESVLDCLLRHDQNIPYACKSGVCQACLVKAVNCSPPPRASTGLKATLQSGGYGLACQWVTESDIEIKLPGATEQAVTAVISRMDKLNPDIMRVILTAEDSGTMFESRPGQYLNVINPFGITRSYSIANDYLCDQFLELHIANTQHGEFTHDALRHQHKGSITLLHGGSIPGRLYYVDELKALALQHRHFTYQALVLATTDTDSRFQQGDIEQEALNSLTPEMLAHVRVYICGAPEFVQGLRKKIFLKGVRSDHIFCDAFVGRKIAPD